MGYGPGEHQHWDPQVWLTDLKRLKKSKLYSQKHCFIIQQQQKWDDFDDVFDGAVVAGYGPPGKGLKEFLLFLGKFYSVENFKRDLTVVREIEFAGLKVPEAEQGVQAAGLRRLRRRKGRWRQGLPEAG